MAENVVKHPTLIKHEELAALVSELLNVLADDAEEQAITLLSDKYHVIPKVEFQPAISGRVMEILERLSRANDNFRIPIYPVTMDFHKSPPMTAGIPDEAMMEASEIKYLIQYILMMSGTWNEIYRRQPLTSS